MGCTSSRPHLPQFSEAYLVFKAYDKNKDGVIAAGEVKYLLRDLGLNYSPGSVRSAIRQMDVNRNTMIEWDEFEGWYKRNKPLQEARKLFKKFANKDGVLSVDGLQKMLEQLKYKGDTTQALLEMDRNRSGTVELDEVVYWLSNRDRGQLKKLFNLHDTDPKDGQLSKKEIKTLLEDIGQDSRDSNVDDIFEIMDTDANGFISFEEFFSWFARNQAVQDCIDLFCEYDEDDSDSIDERELSKLLKDLHIEGVTAAEVLQTVAVGKPGSISLDEFVGWYMGQHRIKRLRDIFRKYDANGDGTLDKGEFMYVLLDLGMPCDDVSLALTFKEIDRDGSGRVELSEFLKWFQNDV